MTDEPNAPDIQRLFDATRTELSPDRQQRLGAHASGLGSAGPRLRRWPALAWLGAAALVVVAVGAWLLVSPAPAPAPTNAERPAGLAEVDGGDVRSAPSTAVAADDDYWETDELDEELDETFGLGLLHGPIDDQDAEAWQRVCEQLLSRG